MTEGWEEALNAEDDMAEFCECIEDCDDRSLCVGRADSTLLPKVMPVSAGLSIDVFESLCS